MAAIAVKKYMSIEGVKHSHNNAYFEIYCDTSETAEKEVDFIINALMPAPNSRILDLGCGFGRHSIELSKRGFDIVGVDVSENLLDIARTTANGHSVEFVLKDIRELEYNNEFDVAFMMLNAFGLLSDEDNERVVERISKAIKKKGKVLIDLRNPIKLGEGGIYDAVEKKRDFEIYTEQCNLPASKRVMIRRYFRCNGNTKDYFFVARLYPLNELRELLARHGLEIERAYGDFDGNSYDKHNSPRLIVVAKKDNSE